MKHQHRNSGLLCTVAALWLAQPTVAQRTAVANEAAQQMTAIATAMAVDRSARPPEVDEFLALAQPRRTTYQKITKVVRELTWHTKLDAATDAARTLDRPILWIQAYGKIDGYA